MTEKSYYAKITKYYLQNATNSMAVELKFTRTDTLSFRCLPPHQEASLLESERVFGYKISDSGQMKKPFDIFILHKAASVFIAIYYKPKKTEIYEISIRHFIHEKYKSWNKSLTIERAKELGRLIRI